MGKINSQLRNGILILAVTTVFYALLWISSNYNLIPLASILFAIIIVAVAVFYSKKGIWDKITNVEDKGIAYIKFGWIWFGLVLSLSLIQFLYTYSEILLIESYSSFSSILIGSSIAVLILILISIFVNLPGTVVFLWKGVGILTQTAKANINLLEKYKDRVYFFAIFWFFVWIGLGVILELFTFVSGAFMIFSICYVPGTLLIFFIGHKLSRKKENTELLHEKINDLKDENLRLGKENSNLSREINKHQKEISDLQRIIASFYIMFGDTTIDMITDIGTEDFVEEIEEIRKRNHGWNRPTTMDTLFEALNQNLLSVSQQMEEENYKDAFEQHFRNHLNKFNDIKEKKDELDEEHYQLAMRYDPVQYGDDHPRRNRKWAEKRSFEINEAYDEIEDDF